MKNKIEAYKKNLIGIVNNENFPKILEKALITDGDYRNASGDKETWEQHNLNVW